ncbi:MAG: hypothetical protein WDO15_15905 [Bacteroidota bacterium]
MITLKNDITFKLNMSVNNAQTIQRKLPSTIGGDDAENIVTNGNVNIQIKTKYYLRNKSEAEYSILFRQEH